MDKQTGQIRLPRIDAGTYESIKALAEKDERTIQQIVRMAIRHYLKARRAV